jgi:hypothetical protein
VRQPEPSLEYPLLGTPDSNDLTNSAIRGYNPVFCWDYGLVPPNVRAQPQTDLEWQCSDNNQGAVVNALICAAMAISLLKLMGRDQSSHAESGQRENCIRTVSSLIDSSVMLRP